jgi:hypothetical protein
MRPRRVSNSMVRANLNVMDIRAKRTISEYAKRNNLSIDEATNRVLGLIRKIERESSKHIYGPAGFTPLLTFVGVKNPRDAILMRAVSMAEHGKIPHMPRIPKATKKDLPRARAREKARYRKFKTIQEISEQIKKDSRNMYKRPITKLEVLQEKRFKDGAGAHKYCTVYSPKYLKEAINALEERKVSPDLLNAVTHEMRELLDPHISAETPLHFDFAEQEKEIGKHVRKKLNMR